MRRIPVAHGWTLVALQMLGGCGGVPIEDNAHVAEVSSALLYDYAVPYLRQRDYTGIGESACGPTSLAMILRYYFPNSRIDVPEIYHAGLQSYGYQGPAVGYRNLSWASGWTTDPGNSAIPAGFAGYYSNLGNSAMAGDGAIMGYLANVWNVSSTVLTTTDSVYTAIQSGPLIGHVWGHGNAAKNWGHYLVIVGIDDRGTTSRTDDIIYVNDPYDNWWRGDAPGRHRGLTYNEFFVRGDKGSAWFRDAIKLTPNDSATVRSNTVVVDVGNNTVSGDTAVHVFYLDDPNDKVGNTSAFTWQLFYGGLADGTRGAWYFPNEAGHATRWSPKLSATGAYALSVRFVADNTSGTVEYDVYNGSNTLLARTYVNQYRATRAWTSAVLASPVKLSDGAYVRAVNIPSGSNIGATVYNYVQPAGSGCSFACSSYGYSPGACNNGWQCDCSNGCLSYTGCTATTMCNTCQYTCAAYHYSPGQCFGGWECGCNGACLSQTHCTASTVCGN